MSQKAIRAVETNHSIPIRDSSKRFTLPHLQSTRKITKNADRSTDAVTQELEFHISVTPVGADEYLVRTERVAPGVPLAEEQISWPVEEWLARARVLMSDPLLNVLQGGKAGVDGETLWLQTEADALYGNGYGPGELQPMGGDRSAYSAGGNFDPDLEMARSLNLVDLGQQLYNSLFYGTLRDSWMTAQGIAQHRREVLRLRLGLKGSRITRLPWEALHAGDRPIATGTDVVFSRYQPNKGVSRFPAKEQSKGGKSSTLRILMVIAAPSDRENLELKREAHQLQQELQNRSNRNAFNAPAMELKILEQPDRAALTQALEQNKYQVFHYAGHSNLGVAGGELYLVSRRTGLTETLTGYDLAGLLVNNGIQLAVFNSCRGAHTATSDPTEDTGERNLAEALVRQGIPAVLAMAERIPDDVALTLARLFYRNLDRGYPVDLSLNRARQGLISAYGSNQLYWVLPILYLHPEFDGYLNSGDRSGAVSASAKEASFPAPRQQNLPLAIAQAEEEAGALEFIEAEFDERDIESVYDEVSYEDFSDPEGSALVNDLLRHLGNPSDDEPVGSRNAGALSPQQPTDRSPQWETYRQPLPESRPERAAQSNPASAPRSQKTSSLPRSPSSKARRKSSNSWIQVAGVLSLGAFALLGLWSFRDLLLTGFQQPQEPLPPITQASSTDENFNKIDLKRASTSEVVALAIGQFNKGHLGNGQRAVETLLDRSALQEARTALAAVAKKQEDDPIVNFLRGRLAWQYVQSGDKDYSLDDVRRRWEAAVKEQPKSPLYYNALAFAYYAQGDLNRASDAWLRVLTLQEEQPSASGAASSDRKPPASGSSTPTPTPSRANRDALTAYAGSALVLMKTAQNQPPTEQASRLSKAIELRQIVLTRDPLHFQLEALGTNWMWPEIAIQDWRSLQDLK